MAISFGRRGSGDGGGSNRVGFSDAEQSSTDLQISNSNTGFTGANFATPSWQLTLRDSGKASIVFGTLIETTYGSNQNQTIEYAAKLQVHVADARNTGNIPSSGWVDVTAIDSDGVLYEESEVLSSAASAKHYINVEFPFSLSQLPAAATNNKYLQFRFAIQVSAGGSPQTIRGKRGYIALKAFGVGAGSTDINGADIRTGSITNAALAAGSVNTNQIVNGAVTRPKIGPDAIDGTKIADNAVGSEHIVANAVGASELGDRVVGSDQLANGAVGSDQLAPNAVIEAKIGSGQVTRSKIAANAITPAQVDGVTAAGNTDKVVAIDSGGGFKLVTQSSGGGGITTVRPDDLEGIVSTDTQQFIKTNFDGTAFTHQSAIDPSDLNVGASGDRNRFVKVKSDGTGFETATGGGGGGITSVDPSDLDGVTGGSGDASKFVKTDSTGNQFEVESHVDVGDLNITDSSPSGKFVTIDSAGTGFTTQGDLTPKFIGFTEGSGIGDRLVGMNTAGTAFEVKSASGSSVTLANITGGPLALNKGGTGYAADDLDGLRQRLGVGSGAITDPELVRSTDADTQKDHTIHRFDTNTSNRPTGATNGIIAREGNDQYLLNVDDGKTWKREISNTGTGTWSTPVAANLTRLQTESDFRTFGEGSRGWTDTDAWLPEFTDGSKPAKVIVGRNGNYLVCIDRNNFFWAPRPTAGTWAEIPWRWEGNSTIPAGLRYTGGETDERLIPAGEDAVIAGKTNIPGENFVTLLVDHQVASGTSTFTGYFVDDDNAQTLRSTTNTVGNTVGSWVRTKVDADGIDDNIIITDTSANEAVFLGIVPSIDDLTFSGYTFKVNASPSAGQVGWYASQRGVRIAHAAGHDHIDKLLQQDVELQIRKDSSNYIRGVFETITVIPGGGGATQAVFRQEGLQTVGTINDGDTVSILGHKAVFTKLEQIPTINIADDAVTASKIGPGAVDNAALAADAVTPLKVAGVDTGATEAHKYLRMNSTGDAFELNTITGGGGGGGDDAIFEIAYQSGSTTLTRNTYSNLNFQTPAWQVANRASGELLIGFGGRLQASFSSAVSVSLNSTSFVQVRYADNEAMDTNASTWETFKSSTIADRTTVTDNVATHVASPNAIYPFALSDLPSGATDGKYIQFRIRTRGNNTTSFVPTSLTFSNGYIYIAKPGAGSGSSGGSGASSIDELDSIYTQSASTYTVAATNVAAASLTAGQAHYVQASGTGNISIHFTSDDSGVNANLTNGSVITFWVANNKYRQLRITGNTAAGSSRIIVGTIVGGAGTIAVGDTLRILYDSTTAYDGVIKVGPDGKFTTGAVSVPSLGIAGAAADVGDILTIGTNGTFDATGGYILPSNVKPAISKSRAYTVVTGSTGDGEYAHNSGVPTFGTTDNGADATFLANLDTAARAGDGTTILIVKDASNYISFRSTGAITQGSNLSLFSSVSNYSTIGTISNGDTVRVWLEPANANQIIQFDAIGENTSLVDLPSGGGASGAVKHTLMCKQEISGSGEISGITSSVRSPLQTQTGTWSVANKATDWIRFSGGGLCYFGNIPAQPICADIEVWYRWKNGTEAYQAWNLANSRVEAFDLGSDRLMVVKLFAGGSIGAGSISVTGNPVTAVTYTDNTRSNSHVDCAVGSGFKFGKLSQLNSAVVDGTDIQFTVAFTTQNPSPAYTARRWFLTADIMDGSSISANY